MFDCIIKNGNIIDGTGSPSYFSDVGIKDGKIAKIGKNLSGAAKIIDASGLVVTPGFIDSHGHADNHVLAHPDLIEKVEQGITVCIAGQCGISNILLPNFEKRENFGEIPGVGSEYDLRNDPEKYLSFMREYPIGSGLAFLVGHGALRKHVMGMENRAPTAEELEKMKSLLRLCLDNGAIGLSFGFYYAPGFYATEDEAAALSKIVAEYDGIVTAHIRNESYHLVRSVKEFLNVLSRSGARGVVSHHKVCENTEYWGKVHHTLQMIDEANMHGQNVYCDMYPYNATSNNLGVTFIAPAEHARGKEELIKLLDDPAYRAQIRPWITDQYGEEDYSWVRVNQCFSNPEYSGKTIEEIAQLLGKDPINTIFDILRDNQMYCSACYSTICEDDLETVLRHPRCMICTDSGVMVKPGEVHHPRMRGTFPRALGKYVRERGIVSLPEMIRKMTAMPARVYGLRGKGLIWENMDADICIFDPEKITDKCRFGDCHKRNEGLNYVMIAGEVVAENAVYNGKRMAKAVLR